MPSKSNKQSKSKAKSKLSSENGGGGTSPSPRTPSAAPNYQLGEEKLRSVVEEASRKFPALLGTNAFVGRIADVDSQSKGGSCRIWLSESSMLASSISPGSTVSVSLALPEGQQLRRSFPLSSLADECGLHFGVECSETQVEEAGNYFVLATVFPSCKVMKENVRLSTNLSHSLGSPASGRAVFVFPIRVGSLRSLTHGGDKMCRSDVDSFFVSSCGKLYLEPLPLNSAPVVNSSMKFLFRNSSDTGIDCLENDGAQSPCTPSSRQSSVSSLHLSNLTHLKALATSSPNCAAEVSGSCDLKEIFENGSATKLLELCATSWLCNRTLLIGNIVTFPILSRLCVFRVTGSERITLSAGKDLSQSPDSEYDIDAAFIVDCTTKVSICLSTDTGLGALKKKVHVAGGIESLDNKPISGDEIQRVGGLRKEYGVLKDIISSSAKSTLSDLGLRTTKGVLLHGPPGTGKTSLAQLCARDAGFNIFKINGPEVISQYYGESEQELQKIFDAASEAAPSVIFIDELDAIAPARKEGGEELSQRMVATLLNLMDGINRTEGLLIIAATNRIESIEPALRRPGRLDREIEIGVPSPVQRLDILTTLLSSMDHSLLQGEIQHLATVTHGFVGADLAALCNEAAMECLRRFMKQKRYHCDPYLSGTSMNFGSSLDDPCCSGDLPEMSVEDPADAACSGLKDLTVSCDGNSPVDSGHVAQDTMTNVQDASAESSHCFIMEEEIEKYPSKVKFEDFEKAKMRIRPSAMREVNLEVPKVKWEDVGGQNEVKAQLMEAVLWPQKHQDALKRIGTRPPTGVLMFGPPGCSKTLMARAVASEAGLNFLAVKGPELFSKWVGESEKAVKSLFDKARANAPSVIFFDEIDSLAVIRGRESDGISVGDRVMSQLLVELDGNDLNGNFTFPTLTRLHERVDVTVVAATNRPDKIDPALRRPGRFDRLVYVGPPNEEERKDIFDIHLRKIPCHMDVDVLELACLTEGFTGADISLVCREAALRALEECLEASEIKMQHLEDAIEHVNPSEIESYDEMSEKFQRHVSSEAKSDVALASQTSATKDQTMGWNPLKWISKLLCRSPAAPL